MKHILVMDKKNSMKVEGVEVVSAPQYLTDETYKNEKNLRVTNLCSSYAYQENGYYVSLLASARRHKVIPALTTILDIKSKTFVKLKSIDLEVLIEKSLKDIKSDGFELSIYFGRNFAKKYDKLAKELHSHFDAPLLRAKFKRKEKWQLTAISPISIKDVPDSHWEDLTVFANEYFRKRMPSFKNLVPKYSLAILIDKTETMPPSNEEALKKLVEAAHRAGIATEFIDRYDMGRLIEFDALFIRVTTAVNHYTYRFAQKAQALGLVVIDDPQSILCCTNKVFLAELFLRNRLPAPKTLVIHHSNYKNLLGDLEFPVVVKQPDSAFSLGVKKAENLKALELMLKEMFRESDMLLIQEYMKTSFDWRIGVLNGKAIYACKYFMARDHWQIYKQTAGGVEDGASETMQIESVDPKLISICEKASLAIGKGLYGIDVKQINNEYVIIEVNDNPSIDHGCEDEVLGDELYDKIMGHFYDRLKNKQSEEVQ